MIRKTAIALMLGLSLATAGEEAAAATADFAPGFQRLVALGLPPLDGAEWIAAGDGERETDDYELREIFSALKGNGWKLQMQGKPVFLPLGMLDPREMPAKSGGGGLLGGLFGGGSKAAKSMDLGKDAAKLIAILDDPGQSKDLRDRIEYRGAAPLGRLLIFAAQLQQSGHPVEANRLAASIFALGTTPESVIDSAVNRLAARDLSRVTEAFFTSRNWSLYERDLRALVERYPRGWENFPAVQMLLPAVAKRVAGGMPAKPAIEGITLHPDAIAALDDSLQDSKGTPGEDAIQKFAKENGIPMKTLTPEMRQQIAQMLAHGNGERSWGAWLIEEPSGAESKDPWSRLKKLGLDALPALAAVANDDSLTFSRNASSSSSYSYGSNRASAEELALAAYKAMDRPLSRGELACRMLASTLPGEDHNESSPQALADAAIEFWKAQHGKSKLDLLLVFLAEGDSSQKSIAGNALAEMPEEAAHLEFEKHVLESDDITSTLGSVPIYLKLRKAAAKDFFTRFSATFRAQLDGADLDEIRGGYEIKRAGGVNKYLKKLGLAVGGESPRKLVLELAMAEKPDKQQIASLAETLLESSPDEFVSIYLEASVKATRLENRAAFLSALTRQAYMRHASAEEAPPEDSPVPPAQVPHWTALLGDDRLLPDGFAVSHHAAGALEQLHSPSSAQQAGVIYQIDPAVYPDLVLSRARERLAGKSPTPLPDGVKVSAPRLEVMLKQLADAKPETVHSLTQAWMIDEKLAFQKWRANPDNVAKLPTSVIASRRLLTTPVEIVGSPSSAQATAIMRTLKLEPASELNYDAVTNLAATLAYDPKGHSGLCVGFTEAPLGTGTIFTAEQVFDPESKPSNSYSRYFLSQAESALSNSEADVAVTVNWTSPNGRWVPMAWTRDATKVAPPDAAILEKFREAIAAREQAETKPISIFISVLHRDDLEKLAKLNLSEVSETSDE